jgi:hypothetical protein
MRLSQIHFQQFRSDRLARISPSAPGEKMMCRCKTLADGRKASWKSAIDAARKLGGNDD